MHDFKFRDGCTSRLYGLKSKHGFDQSFQFSMIAFNAIVMIFDSPMLNAGFMGYHLLAVLTWLCYYDRLFEKLASFCNRAYESSYYPLYPRFFVKKNSSFVKIMLIIYI